MTRAKKIYEKCWTLTPLQAFERAGQEIYGYSMWKNRRSLFMDVMMELERLG